MNKIEIYIVVEGQTEQTFVRDVLLSVYQTYGLNVGTSTIG